MKFYLFFLFIILFALSCSDNIVEPNNRTNEEYLIYSEILESKFNNSTDTIILKDYTESENYDTSDVDYLCETFEGLKKETILNYIEANNEKIKLERISDINCILLSEYDYSLSEFYIVWISRVGFNSSYTQAMVTMADFYDHTDGGGGTLFVLEKINNGQWQVVLSQLIWIS